jgi:hypothetical protein
MWPVDGMGEDNDCLHNFGGEIYLETVFFKAEKRLENVIKMTSIDMGHKEERWIYVPMDLVIRFI